VIPPGKRRARFRNPTPSHDQKGKSRGQRHSFPILILGYAVRRAVSYGALLRLDGVEVIADKLVHLEHVDLVDFENGRHFLVAQNPSFVSRILEIIGFDMLP
jgi:hypothetical protein